MSTQQVERRRSARVFFKLEDEIEGFILFPPGSENAIRFITLSICTGGIGFASAKQKIKGIKKGDQLEIKELRMPEPLGLIENITVKIVYINDLDYFVRVAIGGELLNIPDHLKQRIDKYISLKLKKSGLNKHFIDD